MLDIYIIASYFYYIFKMFQLTAILLCPNLELTDVQPGFRKGRETRDQIANIHWIIEKTRELQKNIYLYFIDYAKALDCMDHNKL